MLLSHICKKFGVELGDRADIDISALNSLSKAGHGELAYCDSDANASKLSECNASAVVVLKEHAHLVKNFAIINENPQLVFAELSALYARPLFEETRPAQIASNAKIMENVHIGSGVMIDENAIIMPGCYIGDNVYIGRDTIIHPNVVIYNNTKIGNNCIINANAVIGSDGFGFAHTKDGKDRKSVV